MAEVSMKLEHIEDNLMKLYGLIANDSDIAKYIYYLNNDPLSEPEVTVDLYENGNYLLTFFDNTIPEQEKIRLYLNAVYGDLDNPSLSDIRFIVEIVVPNNYVLLKGMGQLRPFRILNRIIQLIETSNNAQEENTNRIGIKKARTINFKAGRLLNTAYSVYSIEIAVGSSTVKKGR